MEHTKGEWRVIGLGLNPPTAERGIEVIAEDRTILIARGLTYADANHIVRCVNSHDALVAALQKIIDISIQAQKMQHGNDAEGETLSVVVEARAALKLARGE